ncbi:MAG: DMT family transporter [Lachnospiraceae bacterium]|nr:DMT family transporter [Lachnospiraceae bacterium]
MLYLGLAIFSSAMVSTIMRLGEEKIKNNMGMFVSNYIVCALLSLIFMGGKNLFVADSGMVTVLLLGVISGILYLASFVLLQLNIRKNGVVLSATFMKLGVLIPTIMAIVIFHERPKILQILGILLAIAAIIMIHFEKEDAGKANYKILLIMLMVGSGFTDAMANIYDKLGSSGLKNHYLFFTFVMAAVCAFVLWIKEKQSLSIWDVICGICIGIPNYFSSRFLLGALHSIAAVIVYPVYSVVTIVVISLLSFLLFKERLSKKKMVAIGMIFGSLILLNVV